MSFTPSKYQQAIFSWIAEGRGDAVINAVAGSGKTSTLVEASKLLHSDRSLFLAFNKHIAVELQGRLDSAMKAKTVHSIGCGLLRDHLKRVTVDEDKLNDICKPYARNISEGLEHLYQQDLKVWYKATARDPDIDIDPPEPPPNMGVITGIFKKLAHFLRVTLTPVRDKAAVEAMCDHFTCLDGTIEFDALYYPLPAILKECERLGTIGTIDYDDMLWLPYLWGLEPKYKYEWVFIDECQDLSAAQLDLVLKLRGRGGRMLFVGDKSQSIFGFAGADSESFNHIVELTKATVLPLSICYRCPSSHIKLAQEIVPEIEARENAPEGILEDIKHDKVHEVIQEGDLVISRCAAPVIKLCIELIGKRIPARVRGRDIGKALTSIVKEVSKHPEFVFDDFAIFLKEYASIKVAKLQQKRNSQAQLESFNDRIQGIYVCFEAFDSKTLDEFCREIEALFSDERSSIILSTVHRAKGLENNRVFILEPDKLPLRWQGQLEWQLEQEYCLKYVALTRAKESLFFIK